MATRTQSQGRQQARQAAAQKLRERRKREDSMVADAIAAIDAHEAARAAVEETAGKVGTAIADLVELGLSTVDVADLLGVSETQVKGARRPKAAKATRETELVGGSKGAGSNGSSAPAGAGTAGPGPSKASGQEG